MACRVATPGGRGRVAKQNLWLLACAGAAILLSSSAHAVRSHGSSGLRTKQEPAGQAEVADAVCQGGKGETFKATLSELKPKVSLQCAAAAGEVVPKLLEGQVCPEGVQDLAACKTPGEEDSAANNKPVSLAVLMGGTAETPVNWVESTPAQKETAKKYELSLPKEPLPSLDSTFVTGCRPTGVSHECKLTVKVEARKSAAVGQTVYCAYGANSNVAKPTVTMTQQNNTMTLVCGNEKTTAVQPTGYTTDYCTDDLVEAGCNKEKFTTFIPGFQSAWWTENTGDRSVTLTIPPEHFPDAPKTIHLGCLYTKPETAKAQNAGAANKVLCKVDVAISAKQSSATGRTAAALSGIAVGSVVLSISALTWF